MKHLNNTELLEHIENTPITPLQKEVVAIGEVIAKELGAKMVKNFHDANLW